MALITLLNAQLAFGHVALLDHTGFSLETNERVGLIGRNGAGKSSLLKILGGLAKPDDGTLQVQQGTRIAFVEQEPALDPDATIFQAASSTAVESGQLDGMLGALANADPTKAGGLFDALGKAGALGPMLAKYAQEGAAFLKKLDPSKLSSLMRAFSGGLEFLNQLKKVAEAAGKLAGDIKDLRLPPELDRILKGGRP